MSRGDRHRTTGEFNEAVNMTRKELVEWLETEESRSARERASLPATSRDAGS